MDMYREFFMNNENVKLSPKNNILDLDLLSFISHQLKIPLTTLKINMDLLKQQAFPAQKDSLRMMDEELNHMIHLVSDVLDIRKTKDGKGILHCQWHRWDKVIQSVQSKLNKSLKQINVQLQLPSTREEVESYVDFICIEQVLINLIRNAVEHSPQNSSISVDWTLTNQDELRVTVSDEGHGIAVEDLDKIFTPFYKSRIGNLSKKPPLAVESLTSQFLKTGSGLGLAIARQVVLSHGGDISAVNRPEGGACFLFTLPKARRISHAA